MLRQSTMRAALGCWYVTGVMSKLTIAEFLPAKQRNTAIYVNSTEFTSIYYIVCATFCIIQADRNCFYRRKLAASYILAMSRRLPAQSTVLAWFCLTKWCYWRSRKLWRSLGSWVVVVKSSSESLDSKSDMTQDVISAGKSGHVCFMSLIDSWAFFFVG
jgi:hypothetical protein